jgi:GPH family glycoside/pentoside/hexuronide:cation symporter
VTGTSSRTTCAIPLPWREKLSYGVADMGFNFYWANIATFLMIFYTALAGRSPKYFCSDA